MARSPATNSTAARRWSTGSSQLAITLVATAFCNACTFFRGDSRVLVTSTPAGASITVDGADSGQTTPSMVDLGGIAGSNHEITVRKRGFDQETRQVLHYTTAYTSAWIQGAQDPGLWTLPLWWTMGDVIMPFAVRWRYVPHELHVKLYKQGEGPVTEAEPVAR